MRFKNGCCQELRGPADNSEFSCGWSLRNIIATCSLPLDRRGSDPNDSQEHARDSRKRSGVVLRVAGPRYAEGNWDVAAPPALQAAAATFKAPLI